MAGLAGHRSRSLSRRVTWDGLTQVSDRRGRAVHAPVMPMRPRAVRYFTDFIDGGGLSRDDEGLDFADRQEACQSAAEPDCFGLIRIRSWAASTRASAGT